MTAVRTQLIDLLAAVLMFVVVASVVAVLGGPTWASIGLGWIAYLIRAMR